MDYFGVKLATCSSDRAIKVFDVKQDQYSLHQELVGWVSLWSRAEQVPELVYLCGMVIGVFFNSVIMLCVMDQKKKKEGKDNKEIVHMSDLS